jgi:hypothetical protein
VLTIPENRHIDELLEGPPKAKSFNGRRNRRVGLLRGPLYSGRHR